MRLLQRYDYHFHLIHQISDEAFKDQERPPEGILRYQFDNCELFVIEGDSLSPIISYAIVTRDNGEPYIWSIATKKDRRGLGFASSLLREILSYYYDRHEKSVGLTCNVNNPAQKLYFDHGFRVIRVMPRYYGEVSGLRMRRFL